MLRGYKGTLFLLLILSCTLINLWSKNGSLQTNCEKSTFSDLPESPDICTLSKRDKTCFFYSNLEPAQKYHDVWFHFGMLMHREGCVPYARFQVNSEINIPDIYRAERLKSILTVLANVDKNIRSNLFKWCYILSRSIKAFKVYTCLSCFVVRLSIFWRLIMCHFQTNYKFLDLYALDHTYILYFKQKF